MPDEKTICPACLNNIKIAARERLESEYERKFLVKNIISGFISLYVFEKDKELQHIIHAMKYEERRFLIGKFLGEKLGECYKSVFRDWKIDLIIPIPLHRLKKAERGYNQSFYIAKGLSKKLQIPLNQYSLKRVKFTQTQTAMNLKEREENVTGAFRVKRKNIIKGKTILLIDDVITTGATASECGKVLLKAGANKVYVVSVAIAD